MFSMMSSKLLAGFAELPLEQLLGLGRPTAAPARETPGPGAEPTGEPLTVRVRPGGTAEVRVWVHLLGGRIDGVLAFARAKREGRVALIFSFEAATMLEDRLERIDLFRGLALWLIFIDHLPTNLLTWLTLRNYGFSDAADVFVLLAGISAAFALSSTTMPRDTRRSI